MREGALFTCPECGATSPVGVTCFRCDGVAMLDEDGNAPLPPDPGERSSTSDSLGGVVAGATIGVTVGAIAGPAGMLVGGCIGALGGVAAAHAMARWSQAVGGLRERRRIRRAERGAGALVAIGEAPNGIVRIEGRVRVLRPAELPGTAAVRRTLRETVPCACSEPSCTRQVEIEAVKKTCGRFAVVDATGVAVVDDGCFVLQDAEGRVVDLEVREGDRVEVVGPAARGASSDAAVLASAGYRSEAKLLLFDGRPERPVVIRRLAH